MNVGLRYNELADEYDNIHTDEVSVGENEVIGAMLRSRVSGNVLDLGCGTGLVLDLCPLKQDRYVGIDISDAMIHRAREKYPRHTWATMDMAATGLLQACSFDHVVSTFGSFSYSKQPVTTLRGAVRALRPGGSVFVMAMTSRYPERDTYVFKGEPIFRVTYQPRYLRGIARLAGLSAIRVRGFSFGGDPRREGIIYQLRRDRAFFLILEGVKRG